MIYYDISFPAHTFLEIEITEQNFQLNIMRSGVESWLENTHSSSLHYCRVLSLDYYTILWSVEVYNVTWVVHIEVKFVQGARPLMCRGWSCQWRLWHVKRSRVTSIWGWRLAPALWHEKGLGVPERAGLGSEPRKDCSLCQPRREAFGSSIIWLQEN